MTVVRVRGGVEIPETELEFRAARAGGPGGQGVNTTSSKVELRWNVVQSVALTPEQCRRVRQRLGHRITGDGVLLLTGAEHRSQYRNREAVLARFRALVGEALEPPTQRRPTRPSAGSKRRRRENKQRRSETKQLRRRPQG